MNSIFYVRSILKLVIKEKDRLAAHVSVFLHQLTIVLIPQGIIACKSLHRVITVQKRPFLRAKLKPSTHNAYHRFSTFFIPIDRMLLQFPRSLIENCH